MPSTTASSATAGQPTAASKYCKQGRTLKISDGTITTNKIETTVSSTAADSKTFEQLFGFSNLTYSAYPDAYKSSYKYVMKK